MAAGLSTVALVNMLVDPLSVCAPVSLAGLLPYRNFRYRTPKAERMLSKDWQTVILGTSRSEVSINSENPAWGAGPVFNGSLSGANFYEMEAMFQLALHSRSLKRVVLFADFELFGSPLGPAYDFKNSRLNSQWDPFHYYLVNLLGMGVSTETARTIILACEGRPASVTPLGNDRPRTGRMDHRRAVAASLRRFFAAHPAKKQYERHAPEVLEGFRGIAHTCRERGIELIIVLPPFHAVQLEALKLAGLWPATEDARKGTLGVLTEEAKEAGAPPFALWDFTDYSPYVAEAFPTDDPQRPTRWFLENVHFTRELGDLIIERIVRGEEPDSDHGDGFGVRLTPGNLDRQLDQLRQREYAYAASHPQEIEFVRSIAAESGWVSHERD